MDKLLLDRIHQKAPPVHFWSARLVEQFHDEVMVRNQVVEPSRMGVSKGVMLTVHHQGGYGYGATADLSEKGIEKAFQKALDWALLSAKHLVVDTCHLQMPGVQGSYFSPVEEPWEAWPIRRKIDYLKYLEDQFHNDTRVVNGEVGLNRVLEKHFYWNSEGAQIEQNLDMLLPHMAVTVNQGEVTQTRSLGGLRDLCQQGGLEILKRVGFEKKPQQLLEEALMLLQAPNCPTGKMSLLLAPDQMMLQIHESIGHPLELDRILGDERNYAGTSFVTTEMFGSYAYGSSLLNVVYDPTVETELASYGYDDEGLKAEKTYIIRQGILERPLGGLVSQARAHMKGVANVRASSWNRPPIDRMANLNIEPGDSSFEEMVASIEKGVFMTCNTSWSIDDSRNKFQFGCEWGQLIEKGRLTTVVKNPNYRGVSAHFWRGLEKVGNASTWEVCGTPSCGKGEPNQCVRVGHASPACVFSHVDVFGGE